MNNEKDILAVLIPILTPILAPIVSAAIRETVRAELANIKPEPAPARSDMPETGFLRLPKILSLMGFSKTTLWRRVKAGAFPAPVPLGPGCIGWRVEDVRRAIAAAGGETKP